VVTGYRRVAMITPRAPEVPDSLLAIAEIYTEMGDRFGRSYYQSAADSYQFLVHEYPTSKYCQDAILRVAKLQREQLGDSALSKKTYEDFLKRYPHSPRKREVQEALAELKAIFPHARYRQTVDLIQQNALYIFSQDWSSLSDIKLHLKGTPFQLKVWEALLRIPEGHLSSYTNIANAIHQPSAQRAVGSAIGNNPVGFIIPCHRVIKNVGGIGEYRWGAPRKMAMIGWEAARTETA